MAQLQIETRLQDLHLTPQLPQMDKEKIESHLRDWVVKNEECEEHEVGCEFRCTKGPFISFTKHIDSHEGYVYFDALTMMRGYPCHANPCAYNLPQPMRTKIARAIKKIEAKYDLYVNYNKYYENYSIDEMKNIETLVECACAVMDAVGDAYGEVKFGFF